MEWGNRGIKVITLAFRLVPMLMDRLFGFPPQDSVAGTILV